MFGLGRGSLDPSYVDIDFAMYMETGTLCIYERGTPRGCFDSYAPGDWLTIAVQNGHVVYMKNSVVIYTSSLVPNYPLFLDACIYSPGGTINSAVIAY